MSQSSESRAVPVLLGLFYAGVAGMLLYFGAMEIAPSRSGQDDRELSASKPFLSIDDKQRHALLVGRWYGSKQLETGEFHSWLVDRRADHTYAIRFKTFFPGRGVEDYGEFGVWGESNGIYFVMVKGHYEGGQREPVNPTDPYHHTAYRIHAIDRETMIYSDLGQGLQFEARRVDASFEMPVFN